MSDSISSSANEPLSSNRRIIDLTIQLAVGAVFVIASFRILSPFIDVVVAGGVIAIAVYPLFVGAVILALAYRLLMEWLHYGAEDVPESSPEEAQ